MNKKAQIPYFLIAVVAGVVTVTAIFVMLSSQGEFVSRSKEFKDIISTTNLNYNYVKAEATNLLFETNRSCARCSNEELKGKFMSLSAEKEKNFRYDGAGNFYGKIRNGNFTIKSESGILKVEIDDLFVESQSGYNKIRREFDISLEINETEKA